MYLASLSTSIHSYLFILILNNFINIYLLCKLNLDQKYIFITFKASCLLIWSLEARKHYLNLPLSRRPKKETQNSIRMHPKPVDSWNNKNKRILKTLINFYKPIWRFQHTKKWIFQRFYFIGFLWTPVFFYSKKPYDFKSSRG